MKTYDGCRFTTFTLGQTRGDFSASVVYIPKSSDPLTAARTISVTGTFETDEEGHTAAENLILDIVGRNPS